MSQEIKMSANVFLLHLEYNMLFEFNRGFLNIRFSILVSVDLFFAVTYG